MELRPILETEKDAFLLVVDVYWQEIMPHANVAVDPLKRAAYFAWEGDSRRPQWIAEGEGQVGFLSVSIDSISKIAFIEDFYIVPTARHMGYGRAAVQALYQQLDALGIMQMDLNVRRDTPQALAFWQALGFRIGSYRLRQYRDPTRHESFIGALSSDFVSESV